MSGAERRSALRAARHVPLDTVELLGVAAGLIVAMLVSRYAAGGQSEPARVAAAVAVVALTVAPFLLRRTRRGLRKMRGPSPGIAE
jgi:ABC-type cobalamin transport system permease subunit